MVVVSAKKVKKNFMLMYLYRRCNVSSYRSVISYMDENLPILETG